MPHGFSRQCHHHLFGRPHGQIGFRGTWTFAAAGSDLFDFVTRELEVLCLPTDIPERIVVDVTPLEIGKHLRASDITLSDRVKLLTGADVVVLADDLSRVTDAIGIDPSNHSA